MAVVIATANGNFTTGTTWATVDATSLLDSEAANTALTTSYVESQAFTPGAITIDGIAVKVNARAASPTGTISVRLAQGGVTVAGTEVTINVSDIDSRNGEQGWYLFKFAAPVLLVALTNYTVSAKTSNASQVNLYRNATAGNWSRLLRTTTTGAPAAGDSFHVMGEWTAAATKTDRTVTMDQTAATDYGDNSKSNPPGATINKGGTITWAVTAATNFQLKLSTKLFIYTSGTMNMGTTGSPIPRDSSHLLLFDCDAADGDFGIEVYGTLNVQGQSRSSGKIVTQCLLNTDEPAGQTVLGVDTDTGWLNGDEIALSSTTRTSNQAETRILNGAAGASSLTVTVATTNARSGTSPTQCEVILLTRNARIESASTTLMAYARFGQASTADLDWMSFRYLGATASGKRGVEIETTSAGSFNAAFCSIRNFDNHGFFVTGTTCDNVTISDCVGYKLAGTAGQAGVTIAATSGVNWAVTTTTLIIDGSGIAFLFNDVGGTVTNIRASCGVGAATVGNITIDEITGRIDKTWSGLLSHTCNSGPGIYINGLAAGDLSNVTCWRNGAAGLLVAAWGHLRILTCELFGNVSNNVQFSAAGSLTGEFWLRAATLSGDSTFSTNVGVLLPASNSRGFPKIVIAHSTLGVVSGIKTAHGTADIDCNTSAISGNTQRFADIYLNNTLLASSTEIANTGGLFGRSAIHYQNVDQAANIHKTVYPSLGTIAYETTTFRTASPSSKLTPSGATTGLRLQTAGAKVPVKSGKTITVSVYVQKDGSYTGSAPRLLLLANPSLGITSDTVIATFSGTSGTWVQLTGTTAAASEDGVLTFAIDVDGSAGNVYVDDWSAVSSA